MDSQSVKNTLQIFIMVAFIALIVYFVYAGYNFLRNTGIIAKPEYNARGGRVIKYDPNWKPGDPEPNDTRNPEDLPKDLKDGKRSDREYPARGGQAVK